MKIYFRSPVHSNDIQHRKTWHKHAIIINILPQAVMV